MERLDTPLQAYAWGSRHALAELQGRPAPTAEPEAELWCGTHPRGPARLPDGRLWSEAIEADPVHWLGAAAGWGDLPFLLKLLAAAQPLSIQAHPDKATAERGFAREEAAGIPRDARQRCYRDRNHKPELICALTPFDALCGFRPLAESASLLDAFRLPDRLAAAWPGFAAALGQFVAQPSEEGLETLLSRGLRAEGARRAALVDAIRTGAQQAGSGYAAEAELVERLYALHGADVGLFSALLLNRITLQPGEALYLGAGRLHAYLDGLGVELMAASDNVLRGGCTRKHIAVDELLSVLVLDPGRVEPLRPQGVGAERFYATPAPEFALSVVELKPGETWRRPLDESLGPEIWLGVAGRCAADGVAWGPGEAVAVAAGDGAVEVSGPGRFYRARVGG